jgi:hypothetical protein
MLRFAVASAGVLAAATLALAEGKKSPDRTQLDAVSVHLFLATSGTLSPDVETIEGFGARNFSLFGKGFADNERFYSALIRVRFTSNGEVFAKGTQAEVTVTDRWKKRVVKRERIADLYIGSHGWTFVPVFLQNAACGPFEIVVTGGGRKIVRQLEATCGE